MSSVALLAVLLLAPSARAADAQTKADVETLRGAGLKLYELFEGGWLPADLGQLATAVREGSKAVRKLHAKYPSAVADAYGSGVMTNIEDTFKLFGGGNLERGCISHQSATLGAVRGAGLDLLEVKPIMLGKGLEHHAVIVYPKSQGDWAKSGVVLDGWPSQSDAPAKMTFTYAQWRRMFFELPYARLETD